VSEPSVDTRRALSYGSRMRLALIVSLFVLACGPGRTSHARYPGGSVAFDRTAQDQKALEIADKVVAATGGTEKWSHVKQLRWTQAITNDGKPVLEGEQAWDRWNGRHHARAARGEQGDMIVMRSLYEDAAHVYLKRAHKMRKIEGGAAEAVAAAKQRWEFDTAILFMPFLLEEPGTKLEYTGEAQTDDGKPLDVLKVTFDPKDLTRTATYVVSVARDTNLIARIEIQKAGKAENERLGYAITAWSEGGGLKFPTTVQNLGLASELVTFKDLTVGDPDDTLYVPPL
jgi:hypothetical protein